MEKTLPLKRDLWAIYREDKKREKKMDESFKEKFPYGHRHTIRRLIRKFALAQKAGEILPTGADTEPILSDLHPEAYPLLIRYGKNYSPQKWQEPPQVEPEWGGCYANAWVYMQAHNKKNTAVDPMVYVEGIVFGLLADPMLHAWNACGLTSHKAEDWSHYTGCHWSRYLGIPFTQEEYDVLSKATSHGGNHLIALFHKKYFADIAPLIVNILQRRKTRPS